MWGVALKTDRNYRKIKHTMPADAFQKKLLSYGFDIALLKDLYRARIEIREVTGELDFVCTGAMRDIHPKYADGFSLVGGSVSSRSEDLIVLDNHDFLVTITTTSHMKQELPIQLTKSRFVNECKSEVSRMDRNVVEFYDDHELFCIRCNVPVDISKIEITEDSDVVGLVNQLRHKPSVTPKVIIPSTIAVAGFIAD